MPAVLHGRPRLAALQRQLGAGDGDDRGPGAARISGRAYHVLRAATSGEHTQKALAEMVGIDKTTMVVTVDELEAAGLAERRPSPTDRRAHVIAVTKAGERKLAKAEAIKEQVQAEVLETLPAARAKSCWTRSAPSSRA